MRVERYPSVEENGPEGAERIADMYRGRPGVVDVQIEHGQIPQWGSAIPTSSTFGKTEKGYMVVVKFNENQVKSCVDRRA